MTAGVDGLDDHLAICVVTVGGTAELPVVTVDDNSSVAGGGPMAIEDEGFEDLHILDHKSAVLKDRLGITVRNIRDRFRCK